MTKAWDTYKDVIIRKYVDEGRTLKDVIERMNEEHQFCASIRSYRQHFVEWGIRKYNRRTGQPSSKFSPPTTHAVRVRRNRSIDDPRVKQEYSPYDDSPRSSYSASPPQSGYCARDHPYRLGHGQRGVIAWEHSSWDVPRSYHQSKRTSLTDMPQPSIGTQYPPGIPMQQPYHGQGMPRLAASGWDDHHSDCSSVYDSQGSGGPPPMLPMLRGPGDHHADCAGVYEGRVSYATRPMSVLPMPRGAFEQDVKPFVARQDGIRYPDQAYRVVQNCEVAIST